jgi:RNA polymerase sigma factor for flagellar operon FliA
VPTHPLYEQYHELLDTVIASVCRRNRLSADDAEEFASEFRLKVLEKDCAALARFEGRSSIRTYLTVVATRALQDWRNARWGKWRPSAEAERLGPVARRLERLIVRDRQTLDEAYETMRTNFGLEVSRGELERMAERLPVRAKRVFVGTDELLDREAADTRADGPLERTHAISSAGAAIGLLTRALDTLEPEDRLILRLRFECNLSIAHIARALHLEQKPLYRRIDRLLLELRAQVERQGLTAEAAASTLADGGFQYAALPMEGDLA